MVSGGHLRVKSALNVKEARSLHGMLRDALTERKSGSQSFLSVFDPKVTSEKASPPQSLPHKAKMGTELPV